MRLQIRNVSKTYDNGVQALKEVNLDIRKGMFGLLGPNGAGKSSLMRTIATLQEPDTGEILFDDWNVLQAKDRLKQSLGFLPQEFGVPAKVSAEMLLDYLAVLKGILDKKERKEVVAALLQQTNLFDARKRNVSSYSGGMKQRFGIAQALLGDPQLIIVDEPTAGLDPEERRRFHNLLSEIGEEKVVILSTHIVEDVRDLCNQMAIIAGGKVLLTGEPQRCIAGLNGRIWKKTIRKQELESVKSGHNVISTHLFLGALIIHVFSESPLDPDFEPVDVDLEDVYFSALNARAGQ